MARVTTTTAATTIGYILGDCLDLCTSISLFSCLLMYLSLLTICAAELKTAQLKRDKAVAHFDNVHEAVEVVGSEHEAVAWLYC